ncbi:MAG: hypothetical protein INQ03_15400 [Candidatus Heimdallarchaeota archaeon]|nr:hypothetical protein [Candidatus Heimdallarchaeota archaeon]
MKVWLICIVLFLFVIPTTANNFHPSMSQQGDHAIWTVTSISKSSAALEKYDDLSMLEVGSSIEVEAISDVPLNVSYYEVWDYYMITLNETRSIKPARRSPVGMEETTFYEEGDGDSIIHYDVGFFLPLFYPLIYQINQDVYSLDELFEDYQERNIYDNVVFTDDRIEATKAGSETLVVSRSTGLVVSFTYETDYSGSTAPNFSITYDLESDISSYEASSDSINYIPFIVIITIAKRKSR